MSLLPLRTPLASYQTRTLLLAAGLVLAGALAGCGRGSRHKFIDEHKSAAAEKLAMIKSGTEWQMANQQFLAGDLDKSLKTVDRSIALNPKVAKSHVLRGRVMLEKSRLEEARAEFLEAQKLDPTFVEAHYYLGIVYERVNEPEQALVCYRQAMELDSSNAQYVVAAAEMMIAQNRFDDAESLLTERRRFLEYNAAVRQTLGHIALLKGDPHKAGQFFSEALLLAPADQQITEDLLGARMTCGQFAEAESLLSRLLDKDENKSRRDLKAMHARCFIAMNRPVEAREILQQLTSDKEGSADLRSWIDLGNVAAVLHDKSNLRQSMQRVMAIAPERPEGFMLRAMYCRQDNRLDDALAVSNQAIAKVAADSRDVSPWVLKAMILQDLRRFSEARATLLAARERDPQNPKVAALLQSIDVTNVPAE